VDTLSHRILSDEDAAWRLAMAAHELLDNVRRHGCDGTANLHLSVSTGSDGRGASLRVGSRTDPQGIKDLRALFDRMRDAPDAWTFYVDSMKQTAASTHGSGLGLARIFAEGEMELSMVVGDEGFVSIVAELSIGGSA